MTHVTCRLTAKNRDQLRNPTLAVSRACVGSQRRAMGDSRSPYRLAVRHCRLRPDGDAVALRHSSTALENQRRGVVSTRLQHVFQHSIERVQQRKKRKKHVFFDFEKKRQKTHVHFQLGHLITPVFNTQLPKVSSGKSSNILLCNNVSVITQPNF